MPRRQKPRRSPVGQEAWLPRHRRLVLAVIAALSIAARLVYLVQADGTFFARMYQWRQTDMNYYDGWARQIAAGDWLSASVHVPMHRWHREVAARYFVDHPEVKAALEREGAASGAPVDPEERLWARWMGVPTFYQDPLYAYLLAVTYRLSGGAVRAVFAWQLAVGVLANILIWLLARRFFGDTVAAVAAGLAVLCAPLMFYELLLLRDSLITFAGLGIVWLLDRVVTRGGAPRSVLLGVALGAAWLLKSTFVLLSGAAFLVLLFRARRGGREAVTPLLAAGAGLVLALAPAVARNVAVGVSPLAMASSGPLTFVAANELRAQPGVGFGIDAPELVTFLGSTTGGWRPAVALAFGGHTLASYASLLWDKWGRVWRWFEIPNNEDFYYTRLQAPVLSWLPVTFWLCAPLALVGLVLGAPRGRDIWPMYLLAAVLAVPLVVFYVLGRFRVGFLAAMLPFAALALVELGRALRGRRYGRGLTIAAGIALALSWTGQPLEPNQALIRTADWILPWSVAYERQVYGALDAHDPARAAAAYLEFFRYEPTDAQILASADAGLAPELADMHRECAEILRASGQPALADVQLQHAQRLLSLSH